MGHRQLGQRFEGLAPLKFQSRSCLWSCSSSILGITLSVNVFLKCIPASCVSLTAVGLVGGVGGKITSL